jgi:hypothetical protein
MITFAKKIDAILGDLATLNTSLNLLRRYAEAGQIQNAIQCVATVQTDGFARGPFRDAEWPGTPGDAT